MRRVATKTGAGIKLREQGKIAKITTTRGLHLMAENSVKRNYNRQVDPNDDTWKDRLLPSGMHICVFYMVHNNTHIRSVWKVATTDGDTTLTLDCSFDVFDTRTFNLRYDRSDEQVTADLFNARVKCDE